MTGLRNAQHSARKPPVRIRRAAHERSKKRDGRKMWKLEIVEAYVDVG